MSLSKPGSCLFLSQRDQFLFVCLIPTLKNDSIRVVYCHNNLNYTYNLLCLFYEQSYSEGSILLYRFIIEGKISLNNF